MQHELRTAGYDWNIFSGGASSRTMLDRWVLRPTGCSGFCGEGRKDDVKESIAESGDLVRDRCGRQPTAELLRLAALLVQNI